MGLDVDISLIVGVPLEALGTLIPEEEKVPLFNHLGKLTGRKATVKRMYLQLTDGRRIPIGSNEDTISSPYDTEINWDYTQLLPDNDEEGIHEDPWFHTSDTSDTSPEMIVIGLAVEGETQQVGDRDRLQAYTVTRIEQIQAMMITVQDGLRQRFGYDGPVTVIAHACYSY